VFRDAPQIASIDEIADNHETGGDADANSQSLGCGQPSNRIHESEARPHRPLGITLMRRRAASWRPFD
jgi:hypothetical protein